MWSPGNRRELRRPASFIIFDDHNGSEVVLINAATAELVRTIAIPGSNPGYIRISRDANRLYLRYLSDSSERIEIRSLPNGEPLAQVTVRGCSFFLELDEVRGALMTCEGFGDRAHLVARDTRTLALVADIGEPTGDQRLNPINELRLTLTRNEGTTLIFSRVFVSYSSGCSDEGPRIDVFDGRTFALVNRIDLQGRCPAIIPLPPR